MICQDSQNSFFLPFTSLSTSFLSPIPSTYLSSHHSSPSYVLLHIKAVSSTKSFIHLSLYLLYQVSLSYPFCLSIQLSFLSPYLSNTGQFGVFPISKQQCVGFSLSVIGSGYDSFINVSTVFY
jgi:hypothetical protein